jgi:hypothetical protein
MTAADGLLNDVMISVAGGKTFNDLILNPSNGPHHDSGTTTVTATMSDASTFIFTYSGSLSNGDNFLTITTSGGELLSSVTIDSTGGFPTLKQVRISGITGAVFVPEPGGWALIGGGLLLLPLLRRRSKQA